MRQLPDGHGPMPSPILLQHPLSNGAVTDWDDMEELWRYGIEDELRLDAVEHPVLMADSTATDSSERWVCVGGPGKRRRGRRPRAGVRLGFSI